MTLTGFHLRAHLPGVSARGGTLPGLTLAG